MTTFHNGPADERRMMIRRAPVFLRVVISADGHFDALDQLDDKPEPSEAIYVYRVESQVGSCHILSRGKNGRNSGGWFPVAKYRFLPEQPADSEIRDNEAWRNWTRKIAALQP